MEREKIHLSVGYRVVIAVVLALIFFRACSGTAFAEEGSTETQEPKSTPVTRHEPQVYVVDYTKETAEKISNEATGQVYGNWGNLPILFPGDTVKIIPDMPDKTKAVSGTANGVVGVVFKNPNEATDRYPINVTKVVELGESSSPDYHDNKIIQEFVVEGDGPVALGSNSGGGYCTEEVELDDISHAKVTLGYHAEDITFRYFLPYISMEYACLDPDDKVIDPSKVVTYTKDADPDAIWAEDAIHNLDKNAEQVTYTISRPYIEGYQMVLDYDIHVNSYGYNRPLYGQFDGKDMTEITPRWAYTSHDNGDYSLYVKSDGEWAAAVFCFSYAPTVTLDACGGTIDGVASRIYEMRDEYDLREREEAGTLIPVWDGHIFDGWYLDAEYTKKAESVYDVLNSMSEYAPLEERVAHIYAKWHTLQLVKEKAATTKAAGCKAYYKCTDDGCDLIFDVKTLKPIADPASLIIPKLPSGWIIDEKTNTKKYIDPETGKTLTGIRTISGKKYYFGTDGVMKTGKQTVSKKTYYFDPKTGVMKTSAFVTISKVKCYFGADGVMVTGFKKIGSYTYYFTAKGKMVTGWNTIDKNRYYFTAAGKMVTGWKTIGKNRYYFTAKGKMVKGWKTIGKNKYYFKTSGAMAKSEYWSGYYVNAKGVRTNKAKCTWKKTAKGKRFGNKTWYAKGVPLTINGKKYKFNKNGFTK